MGSELAKEQYQMVLEAVLELLKKVHNVSECRTDDGLHSSISDRRFRAIWRNPNSLDTMRST
jgi:hypothetical protein